MAGTRRAEPRAEADVAMNCNLKRCWISGGAVLMAIAGGLTLNPAAAAETQSFETTPAVYVRNTKTSGVATTARVQTVAYVRPRRRHRRVVVVRRRPFSHSAAIVGGSALAGAGVGALAGGPHGAIVGGLVGGAGGLIYDRKTHKKKRVIVRR